MAAALLPRGRFVRKKSHRGIHWYIERSEGGGKRQVALGPESPELLRWIGEVRELWAERAAAKRRGPR